MARKKGSKDKVENSLNNSILSLVDEFKKIPKTKWNGLLIYQTLRKRGIVHNPVEVKEALLELEKSGDLIHVGGYNYEDGRV